MEHPWKAIYVSVSKFSMQVYVAIACDWMYPQIGQHIG